MPTITTLSSVANAPVLVKTAMSEEEFLALGETKHHEYYDGMCVVNPPSIRHQRAELALVRLCDPLIPVGFELLLEAGWRTGGSWFEPDLMILPIDGPVDIAVDPPLLIVEILSPSNRLDDLVTKQRKYAAGGLPWYWIVDLDAPSITVLQLIDDIFLEVQRLTAPDTTVGPLHVAVDPATLAGPPPIG